MFCELEQPHITGSTRFTVQEGLTFAAKTHITSSSYCNQTGSKADNHDLKNITVSNTFQSYLIQEVLSP